MLLISVGKLNTPQWPSSSDVPRGGLGDMVNITSGVANLVP